MLTNKSNSLENSQKCTTPREKKIGELAMVLERQRKTIKGLLENQSSEKTANRNEVYLAKINPSNKTQRKEPQKSEMVHKKDVRERDNTLNKIQTKEKAQRKQPQKSQQIQKKEAREKEINLIKIEIKDRAQRKEQQKNQMIQKKPFREKDSTLSKIEAKEKFQKKNQQKNQQFQQKNIKQKEPQKKEPQKYRQICNQILDIGNRVLNSYRKTSPLQTYRDGNISISVKEEKAETTDKQLQYLKSDDYRLYLQNLANEADSGKSDLLKRMKQTRNNNVYAKAKPAQKPNNEHQIKSQISERKTYRQYKEEEMNRRKRDHNPPQQSNHRIAIKGWRRQNQRLLNVFDQISLLSAEQDNKSMTHSPTMKDISKPAKVFHNLTTDKQSRSVSKNNKIHSKTVQFSVFNEPAKHKRVQQAQNIQPKERQAGDSPNLCRHSKQRNLQVFKLESLSIKNKNNKNQAQERCVMRQQEYCALKECYSAINITKQPSKTKISFTQTKPINHYGKYENRNDKYTKRGKIDYRNSKLEQTQKQNNCADFSDMYTDKIQNINLYDLNFKLADPKIRPSYSQCKLVNPKYSQTRPTYYLEKQNNMHVGKSNLSYKQLYQQNPKKQFERNKAKKSEAIPLVLHEHINKTWKLQESQTTSTVTRSAFQEPQNELRTHSRSKSKLSLVSHSKKDKR